MLESLGIYLILIMHFPMLKCTKLEKTVVFWSCSALCAWDEPSNMLDECMFWITESTPGNNLYSGLHAYPISLYLGLSAC